MNKLSRILEEELQGFHPRLVLVKFLSAMLPPYVGSRMRSTILRSAGFHIGRGTIFFGLPQFTGGKNLHDMLAIGEMCLFNVGCFFDLGGPIQIADRAGLAHEVMVLTTTHKIGSSARRAGDEYAQPVSIGEGVWIGSRAIIFPGVTIGHGAVVGAGAVVTKDVPANSVIAGVPAKVIRFLSDEEISANGANGAAPIRTRQLG